MIIAFHLPKLSLGGVEMNAVKLGNEYVRQGHKVLFIVHKFKGEYCTHLDSRIEIIDLKTKNIFTAIPKLKKLFKKITIDVLVSSRDLYNSVLIWIKHKKKLDFYLIASCHTNAVVENRFFKNWKRKIKTKLYMKMAKKTYRFADEIVAVSEGVAKSITEYTSIPLEDISVIYNPIIDGSFYLKANDDIEGDVTLGDNAVVAAGRLTEQKNFNLLIKAFSLVLSKVPDAKLFIFGDGEERQSLMNLIDNLKLTHCVFIHKYVDNVLKYMKRAKVFVLSSRWEGFGNVLAEAMACGTHLVSTDCESGPSEILENGKYGILTPNDSVEGLAEGIIKQLTCPYPEKADLIKASKRFEVSEIAKKYISKYEKKQQDNI